MSAWGAYAHQSGDSSDECSDCCADSTLHAEEASAAHEVARFETARPETEGELRWEASDDTVEQSWRRYAAAHGEDSSGEERTLGPASCAAESKGAAPPRPRKRRRLVSLKELLSPVGAAMLAGLPQLADGEGARVPM